MQVFREENNIVFNLCGKGNGSRDPRTNEKRVNKEEQELVGQHRVGGRGTAIGVFF